MQLAHKQVEIGSTRIDVPDAALVDGRWVAAGGPERAVVDPATGQTLLTVTDSTAAVVDDAVAAARTAFDPWWSRSTLDRAGVLDAVADALHAVRDEMARLETVDTGKPLAQSISDVNMAVRYFRFYGQAAQHLFGETIPLDGGTVASTYREPFGVVAHITPWNAPLSQLARGVAPSLAVGNTVVLKPSELAPLSSLLFARIVQEILPAGVFNLVPGDGAVTGAALAGHAHIDHMTFTGSVATGAVVARATAANVVACNLELGGKSPALVFPDADLDAAVGSAAGALIRNSGQSCSALSRFVVHRDVVDDFVGRLVTRVAGLRMGAGIEDPDVGPMISEQQRDRVLMLIREAVEQGARLACGGSDIPTDAELAHGYFVRPTVLSHVDPDSTIARTEVFGPVQSVLTFDDETEAVRIANDTPYGLASAVFTSDVDVAHRTARRIRAGQVQINGFVGAGAEVPFGGYGHSGHGREKGFEALYGYTQVKAVVSHVRGGR